MRHRDYRLIWGAQVASELGDWAGRLALAVLVQESTNSASLVALVTTASVLPYLGPGQWLATALDRLPRRHILVLSDFARAIVFIALATKPPAAVLLIGAFVAALFSPPFEASRSALIAGTVPVEDYPNAVAVASMTFQLSVLLGYGLGGAAIGAVGARAALLLNAASFLVSAALLTRVGSGRVATSSRANPVRLRDGWRAIRSDRFTWIYATTFSLLAACSVVPESLVAAYAPHVQHGTDRSVAILASCIPLGAIAGIALFRSSDDHRRVFLKALFLSCCASGGAAVLFALSLPMPIAATSFLAVGVFNASIVPANGVTNMRLEDRTRSASFSILVGAIVGSQALGAAVGGVVARAYGINVAIVAAMVGASSVSAFAVLRLPRNEHTPTTRPVTQTKRD
jgi:predicted MFS family arabinose efflux permease